MERLTIALTALCLAALSAFIGLGADAAAARLACERTHSADTCATLLR